MKTSLGATIALVTCGMIIGTSASTTAATQPSPATAAATARAAGTETTEAPGGTLAPAAGIEEASAKTEATMTAKDFYSLQTRTLEGEPAELSRFRGQVTLVVNVASQCGMTPQYEGLEALHRELQDRGFSVLGFPSNDFGNQEPGTAEEIREFCSVNFGVTFPMFEKMQVRGEEKSEVYRILTKDHEEPTWNFTKYLVGRDGQVLARFGHRTRPDDPDLRERVDAALAQPR